MAAVTNTQRYLQSQANNYKNQKKRALEELESSPQGIKSLAKGYLDSARVEFKTKRTQKDNICLAMQMTALAGVSIDLPNSILATLRREALRKQALATSLFRPPTGFERSLSAIQQFIKSKDIERLAANLLEALCEDRARNMLSDFVDDECTKEILARNPTSDVVDTEDNRENVIFPREVTFI